MRKAGRASTPPPKDAQDKAAALPSTGKASTQGEDLVTLTSALSSSIVEMMKGELQGTLDEYELLERMHKRASVEYKSFGDIAIGLGVYVENLKRKNDLLNEHLKQIAEVEHQVSELEDVVSQLDKYTSTVEGALKGFL